MAKLRIFVSSTFNDLVHIRDGVDSFIKGFGYESVLFERGGIAFGHHHPNEESGYDEINKCNMLILIIGGRYGTEAKRQDSVQQLNAVSGKSITIREYDTARERDIPIFIFINKRVWAEFDTYQVNPEPHLVNYAHVDNVRVFEFIKDIFSQDRNNFAVGYDRVEDITNWLRDQWSGLFEDLISKRSSDSRLKSINSRVDDLGEIAQTLKQYSEAILKNLNMEQIIEEQKHKLGESRIRAFADEELVRTILRHAGPEKTEAAARLYRLFGEVNSFEGLLRRSGLLTESRILTLLTLPSAQDAYRQIAERYFHRN